MSRQETAEKFDNSWIDTHHGFSAGAKENGADISTPMLEAFVKRIQEQANISVFEGGAGSGLHSVEMAENLKEGSIVLAADTSEKAIAQIDKNAGTDRENNIPVIATKTDILSVLSTVDDNEFNGAIFNSVLHFLDKDDRQKAYELLYKKMPSGGVLAVSYKAQGDFLEADGDYLEKIPEGTLVLGKDGITRLFVDDPSLVIQEAKNAGFVMRDEEQDIHEWAIQGYNQPGTTGKFIGFVLEKP